MSTNYTPERPDRVIRVSPCGLTRTLDSGRIKVLEEHDFISASLEAVALDHDYVSPPVPAPRTVVRTPISTQLPVPAPRKFAPRALTLAVQTDATSMPSTSGILSFIHSRLAITT